MQLFQKSKELEGKISTFLMNIVQAGFLLNRAFERYFESGVSAEFLDLRAKVSALEAENDSLRRELESQLYIQMLLPDMRSDILTLIEGCDKIINKYESDLILISLEKPKIPKVLTNEIKEMIKVNTNCVGVLIGGFKLILAGNHTADFIREVSVLEHQVDIQAIDLKQKIFKMQISLARQLQLKDFIYSIEKISDMAEDMADMFSVFIVKHAI